MKRRAYVVGGLLGGLVGYCAARQAWPALALAVVAYLAAAGVVARVRIRRSPLDALRRLAPEPTLTETLRYSLSTGGHGQAIEYRKIGSPGA